MRHARLLLVVAALAATLPPANAGPFTTDVYRSQLLVRDRAERPYSIEATVEDTPSGAQLVLEIRRRCRACRPVVYAKTLGPDELVVSSTPPGPECQCMSARVDTKFGGRPLTIDWVWDPEQGGSAAGGAVRWTAVTGNNLLNVSCFGSGTYTSTPAPLSGDAPRPPRGAKEFPKRLPPGFRRDPLAAPRCDADSP